MAIRTLQTEAEVEDNLGHDDLVGIVGGAPAPAPAPVAAPAAPAPSPWEPLAQQISQQWQQFGINPEIQGINRANELAQILSNYGISDLSKLGLKQTPYEEMRGGWQGGDAGEYIESLYKGNRGQLTYGDQTFGRLGGFGSGGEKEFATPQEFLTEAGNGRYGLGYSAAGKGWTDYEVVARPDGTPVIVPKWGSSSDLDPGLIQVLALAAMPFTGGLTAALTPSLGAVGAKIATQALISGGLGGLGAASQGGDFLSGFGKGALTGGITGGLTSFVDPAIAKAVSSVMPESASDLMVSGAQNIAQQAVKSAVLDRPFDLTAALSPVAGEYLQSEYGFNPKTAGALVNLGTKALTGGDIKPSDLLKFASFTTPKESAPKVAEAPQEAGAGYGGVDQGYFDEAQEVTGLPSWAIDPYVEEAAAPETQRYPVTTQREPDLAGLVDMDAPAPAPQYTPEDLEFIQNVVQQEAALPKDETQQVDITGNLPEQTLYELPEAPVVQDLYQPPGELEGPSTIETTGSLYKPDISVIEDIENLLTRYEDPGFKAVTEAPTDQSIEVTGAKEVPDYTQDLWPPIEEPEPIYEQPPTPEPEPIYEQPPTPAPTPPAPGPAPRPPSPAPAPAAQSPDLSSLLSLLGRGQGAQTTYNPVLFQGQAIDLDKLFGYREPSSINDLLGMIGQRPRG